MSKNKVERSGTFLASAKVSFPTTFHHEFTTFLPSKNHVPPRAFSKRPLKNPSKMSKRPQEQPKDIFFQKSPSKVVWAFPQLPCTLQPLRGRKTVQEIHGLFDALRSFAAPLTGFDRFGPKRSFDAGPKASGVLPS
jgi:hypothetical protein